MRVRIHRGTHEIGGTCVELESDGARLLLDLGLPLDDDPTDARSHPAIQDLAGDGSLLALVVSHGHRDHVGLSHLAGPTLPVALGAATLRILQAATAFVPDRDIPVTGIDSLSGLQGVLSRCSLTSPSRHLAGQFRGAERETPSSAHALAVRDPFAMPSPVRHPVQSQCLVAGGTAAGIIITALGCFQALAAPKPASALTPYAGTWAPSIEQCRDSNPRVHQRLRLDANDDGVYDGRAPDVGCHVAGAKTNPTGLTANLICEIGQESPFSFRTEIAILRTGPRSLSLTNTFIDRKPETLNYVRCTPKDLQVAREGALSEPDGTDSGPRYTLPALREGEFYAGQAYPADYAERRVELLDAKAKALARQATEPCTHPFCQRYPEIRACYDNGAYCVGRWERADGATIDYVVKPDDLTVLKTICRDTCGADEIRLPVR